MGYLVYIHTNKTNGKSYIGITNRKPGQRWENGNGYYGQPFYRAIRKYGWENFEHRILCEAENKLEAELLEQQYIRELGTTDSSRGYNATAGGKSANGLKHTEETKQRISASLKGRPSPAKGRRWSEEAKQKISGENSKWYGKNHTAETREKMSQAAMGHPVSDETRHRMSKNRKTPRPCGKDHVRARAIACIETGNEFQTLTEAANFIGVKGTSKISDVCRGVRKRAHGYTWKYLD